MDYGVLTEAFYYILLSLSQPLHGYGIMQLVEELSHGRVRLAAGTLYGALNTLQARGWIAAQPEAHDSRKKSYRITAIGRDVLLAEIDRLEELVRNGRQIMKGESHA